MAKRDCDYAKDAIARAVARWEPYWPIDIARALLALSDGGAPDQCYWARLEVAWALETIGATYELSMRAPGAVDGVRIETWRYVPIWTGGEWVLRCVCDGQSGPPPILRGAVRAPPIAAAYAAAAGLRALAGGAS